MAMQKQLDRVYLQGKKAIRQYSLQTIKKSVDMKSKLEDAILGTVSARSEMMMRRKQLATAGDGGCYRVTLTPPCLVIHTTTLSLRLTQLYCCHSHSYISIYTATLSFT